MKDFLSVLHKQPHQTKNSKSTQFIYEFIVLGMLYFGSIGRFFFSSLLFCIFVATVYPFHALLKFILYPFSVKICYCHKKVMSIIIIIHSLGLSQLGQSIFEFFILLTGFGLLFVLGLGVNVGLEAHSHPFA